MKKNPTKFADDNDTMSAEAQRRRRGHTDAKRTKKSAKKCLKFVVIGITFDYMFMYWTIQEENGGGDAIRCHYTAAIHSDVINNFPDSTLFREICFIVSILNMGYAININSVFHFVVEKFIFKLNSITIISAQTHK